MQPRQAAYLLDILRSAEAIQEYISGLTYDDFMNDRKTQDAVLRRLLVIGEAAARVDPETADQLGAVPFRRIVAMRNRLVHDYGHIDLDIVWDVVNMHLQVVRDELGKLFGIEDLE